MTAQIGHTQAKTDKYQGLNNATLPSAVKNTEAGAEDLFSEFSKMLDKIAVALTEVSSQNIELELPAPAAIKEQKLEGGERKMKTDIKDCELKVEKAKEPAEKSSKSEEQKVKPEEKSVEKSAEAEHSEKSEKAETVTKESVGNKNDQVVDKKASEDQETQVNSEQAALSACQVKHGVEKTPGTVEETLKKAKEAGEAKDSETVSDEGAQENLDLEGQQLKDSLLKSARNPKELNSQNQEGKKAQKAKPEETLEAVQEAPEQLKGEDQKEIKQLLEHIKERLVKKAKAEQKVETLTTSNQAENNLVTQDSSQLASRNNVILPQLLAKQLSLSNSQNIVKPAAVNTQLVQATTETGKSSDANSESGTTEAKQSQRLPRNFESRTLAKVQEVLKEVARSRDGKTISLRLDPPSLGQVKIDVTYRDGILHARLQADSSQVSALLREHGQDLQFALRKLGLEVDDVKVSVSAEQNNSQDFDNFTEQQNSNQGSSSSGETLLHSGQTEEQAQVATPTPRMTETQTDYWVA